MTSLFHFDRRMKMFLKFIAWSMVGLTLSNVVSTEKYPFIGECKPGQERSGHYTHVTFICDRNTFNDEYCRFNGDCDCPLFDHCFCKSKIQKIDFLNCVKPKVLTKTFRDFSNANDLDMSHLGMTTDQIAFLAEPNKLTRIDASHNNIGAISNGMRLCWTVFDA